MTALAQVSSLQSSNSIGAENGTLFAYEDKHSYPPEFTFVVINVLPNVPVYYDRKQNTWWTAIADKDTVDIFSRNELWGADDDEEAIYWQPIMFNKADVLFIPSEKNRT
jgi:hypothetical protein